MAQRPPLISLHELLIYSLTKLCYLKGMKNRYISFAAVFTFIFAVHIGNGALAEPTVSKNIQYYDVKGWDPAFIVNELNSKGPYDRNDGKRVWAHTRWRVKWFLNFDEQNTSCKLTSVGTSVAVDFVVPRWVDRDKAKPYMHEKWDAFYLALQRHEQVHAMHGVRAAREIEQEMMAIGEKRLCSQIRDAATPIGEAIIKKYSDMDIEFDERTDHGKKEGIQF